MNRRVPWAYLLAAAAPLAGVTLILACGGGDANDAGGAGASPETTNWSAEPVDGYPYPVQMLPNEAPSAEGRHFGQGEFQGYNTARYGSDPPTSGKHIGQLAQAGVYDQAIPNEVAVHHMEHGYTLVWYNCGAAPPLDAGACTDLRNQLTAIVQPAVANGLHVVMTPDDSMPVRIALTAWQFMDTMSELDQDRVNTFLEAFECHYDPEETCD